MVGNWELDIKAGSTDGTYALRVLVKGVTEAEGVEVIPACGSVEELKAGIARMKGELDELFEVARRKMRAIESGGLEPASVDPAQAWKTMESLAANQDMFNYFNSLSTEDRERIADYVLTQVSMFKGRGPVFSEHYDASTHLLE